MLFFWLLASVLRPLALFADLYEELQAKPSQYEDVYEPNSRRPAGLDRLATLSSGRCPLGRATRRDGP